MRNTPVDRLLVALALVIGLPMATMAQATEPPAYAVHVAGLTTDERDAVVRDLATSDRVRVVFACVPAGVMVFQPAPNADRGTARSSAITVLEARTQRNRMTETTMSLADAEAACAEARNR